MAPLPLARAYHSAIAAAGGDQGHPPGGRHAEKEHLHQFA
jgi:hypothetical protein